MAKYDPETEIPKPFWDSIQKVENGKESLRLHLEAVNKESLIDLFRHFVTARTELADAISLRPEAVGASEDALDDLADSIIAQGQESYLAAYHKTKPLPERRAWGKSITIAHLFCDVFDQNFGENIYDYIEP
jgi:hypothetical protein